MQTKNKILAILGSGHLGQQIAHFAVSDNHYSSVVFFDDFTKDTQRDGYKIIGTTKDIVSKYQENQFDELIIAIGYKHLSVKKELYQKFKGKIPLGKIIHSTCWIDKTASIGEGCVLYPNCTIDAGVTINDNTLLNVDCTVAHDTVIGKNCFLSPRVALAGFITIDNQCIIGINTTIIDNITIVANTQIGGGSVVIKSIDTSGLYVGNPQRFVRKSTLINNE